MRKPAVFLFGLMLTLSTFSQTLNVNQGNVTYAYPAAAVGNALVNGNMLTIGKKSFDVNAVRSIVIDDANIESNSVAVVYDDASAHVVIAGGIAHLIDVKVRGAHVTVLQSAEAVDEITYKLSGSSADGSLYMDGSLKATFVFDGLTLTNPDSCAVNIQDGKRINIVLKEGKVNSLTDGIRGANDGSDAHKACFYVDGHVEFNGAGSLIINGKVNHGFSSDEYCQLKAGTGTITVASAPNDGFHIGQYFLASGGTVNITSQGDGIDVGKKKNPSTVDNGKMFINAGNFVIRAEGKASKGIKCDDAMEINGGELDITCTGDAIYDAGTNDMSSVSVMKCDGKFTMTAGIVKALATGKGGRLLNAVGDVVINGGKFSGASCGSMYVNDSQYASKGHGIKTDANIIIAGGEVYVAASEDEGRAFKTDYALNINGGTVMGIGGKKSTPSTLSLQKSVLYPKKGSSAIVIKNGQTVAYDGVTFTVPTQYTNKDAKIVVSRAGL